MSLTCTGVNFFYGSEKILSDVSFEVSRGSFCALLGRNGSGKTTLLHCLNGLLKPQAGQIEVAGLNISRADRRTIARKVSLVPQEHSDIFPFSVLDVVVMGRTAHLGFAQRPGKADYEEARHVLDLLKVSDLARRSFNRISGGERQIALLARALLQSSETLLLDEPTNHLDFKNQYIFLDKIKSFCRDRGTRVIAAMHDPNMARLFADQVVMLKAGQILFDGPSAKTMTAPNVTRLYGIETRRIDLPFGASQFLPEFVCGHGEKTRAVPPSTILVTGGKHLGKTTLVARFIEAMAEKDLRICGILAKGLWKKNLREGFDLVDLSDGSTTPLARRMAHPVRHTGFEFFEAGMTFGARALSPERCRHADIVVVDEVGKLEARGDGWAEHIDRLRPLEKPLFVWVVRMESLEKICRRFGLDNPPIVRISESAPLARLETLARKALDYKKDMNKIKKGCALQ